RTEPHTLIKALGGDVRRLSRNASTWRFGVGYCSSDEFRCNTTSAALRIYVNKLNRNRVADRPRANKSSEASVRDEHHALGEAAVEPDVVHPLDRITREVRIRTESALVGELVRERDERRDVAAAGEADSVRRRRGARQVEFDSDVDQSSPAA